jgi:hypothetical protein
VVYGTLEPPGSAMSLTLAGLAGDGSAYNKTFAGTSNSDGTWRVLLDAMPTGGNLSIGISCAACSGPSAGPPLANVPYGDVYYCAGQSNAWLPLWFTFARNESDAGIRAGRYDNIRYMPNQQRDVSEYPTALTIQAAVRCPHPPLLASPAPHSPRTTRPRG